MKTAEQVLMHKIWLKAWKEGSLDVPFKTRAGAVRGRMQLYNAVKMQKSGTDMTDMDLVHAAEGLEIIWVGESTIRLRRRSESDMIKSFESVIGESLETQVDPAMVESAERLLRELEGLHPEPTAAPVEHLDTPFYPKRG